MAIGVHLIPSKRVSTVIMAVVFAASWWQPPWPAEQALHSSLTVAAWILLWFAVGRYGMRDSEYFLIALLLAVHCVAARWLYSNVPYEEWLKSSLGVSLHAVFGWKRNNFDRLVHFLYGFCFTPAIVSLAAKKYSLDARRSFFLAITVVMVTSLWYEWFEWLVAVTLGADRAEAYNGQQGDMWDSHKDILLATVGSLVWWRRRAETRVH